jgi:FemAB-related protein (PEP-CTERM system-associated)
MALIVRELGSKQETAWDDFVDAMPGGTFFHRAGWRQVIEHSFGHRSCYIFAEQDGVMAGVLPLIHVRSLLFGSRLISTPFCVYGGPLAIDTHTAQALTEYSVGLMRRTGARFVEFRAREPGVDGWETRSDLYATFRKPIASDPEKNLKAIPRKQRAVVRKGIQNRLHSRIDQDTDSFHRIYAESVRDLGTPVFSRRYLRMLMDCFRDCTEVLTVLDNGKPIAAVLSFFFRDEVLPYYGGGTPRARHRGANDFMYWELMTRAAMRGAWLFDFGRSKFGTGSFAFKKNWGFEPEPLHYQYWLQPGHAIPDHNPLNPKYRAMIAAWKRLPLPIANLIGPAVVRGIG